MNTFNKEIKRFIQEQGLLSQEDRVLVACSGGVDSVTLLHFLATNEERFRIKVAAVHVDHMLRGVESAADGVLVAQLCEQLNVPFHGGHVPVPEIIDKQGGNVQAVCREGRYAYFSEVMKQYNYEVLATAHHGEDQLESVLMQVTKGVTPSGMPIKRKIEGGTLIRPFLPTVKETLYRYAEENKLPFHEDPSNESDAYMRNRFRQQMTPFILAENPNAARGIVALTSSLQEDEVFLASLAKERLDDIVVLTTERLPTLNRIEFLNMPSALQRRMIPLLLGYLYDEENVPIYYKSKLVDQLLHHIQLGNGNVSLNLPLGYKFIRSYDELTFVSPQKQVVVEIQKRLCKGMQTKWSDELSFFWTDVDAVDTYMFENVSEVLYFDVPDDALPLSVRNWKDGDRIMLPGMNHLKRLSRLFIDEKVSKTNRERLPIIVTAQDEVCAVPGVRYGNIFSKTKLDTSKYIFIVIEN